MEVKGYHQLFGHQHSSYIFFCIKQKEENHTGLEQVKGE